ncbi:hypothetical protein P168DRAFT_301934 [Aspergillus campestris IBT 28561]|uniref:Vacuolar sorting protein Vps3844 C-terminal domain-containing protein n=1 Tax=Aspergillus campestris (strain IBT 28561) TaxID=1392248 RepID=A0A2I1DAL1_ASPC2|nr:uncharacterized protein P168DRAFT_301934 [Aspergillus campestris IBT 28561]PKY06909.1 hypothetical protein P168DRAFT_301934 [Aspergillus campestris IBT 28561]
MRQFSNILNLWTLIACGVSAWEASILAFEPQFQWDAPRAPALSGAAAQQLLDHRLKSSVASNLGDVDPDTIKVIDRLAGAQDQLFGLSCDDETLDRSFFVIEGLGSEVGSSVLNGYEGAVTILDLPTTFPEKILYGALKGDTQGVARLAEAKHCVSNTGIEAESRAPQAFRDCFPRDSSYGPVQSVFDEELINHVKGIESWVDTETLTAIVKISLESPNNVSSRATDAVKAFFHGLHELAINGKEVTALVLQESSNTEGLALRTKKPRAVMDGTLSKNDNLGSLVKSEYQDSLLSTSFPSCFTSEASCIEATHGCSGHGSCYNKQRSVNGGAKSDCYTCKCRETITRKEDGSIQKSSWGGSACQKRDISTPFFLVAGISIMAIAATGAAVGMLYYVGQEELPGVISAGVGTMGLKK